MKTGKITKLMLLLIIPTLILPGFTAIVDAQNSGNIPVAPGPSSPLDTKILEDFSVENGWDIAGADIEYSDQGAVFTLSEPTATISKTFNYPTWEYSSLSINIKEIMDQIEWGLKVKGVEPNSTEVVIQKDSPFANSKFGESFTYSLEGIAGAQALSNWNDETLNSKEFVMTIALKGVIGKSIKIGEIKRIKPNYSIPQASPSNIKGEYAGMNFDGNQSLDVDTLKNDDPGSSTSSSINEHQWASLPYSRLVINPGYEFDNQKVTPVNPNLDFSFGVYYGIKGNSNKAQGIREGKSGFQSSLNNALLSIDDNKIDVASITSSWYPHKLERGATVTGKGSINLVDFMVDNNTMGRIIDFSTIDENSALNITVKESVRSGSIFNDNNNLKAYYDTINKVVIKTDELDTTWNKNLFYQAIRVVALNDDGSYNPTNTELITAPSFMDGVGKYDIPATVKKIGLAIGYATREEGKEVAISRAKESVENKGLVQCYNTTKTYWDEMLQSVPVPTKWGVSDTNIKDGDTVTEEKHRVLYYAGWVHNFINILGSTPETGYAYTQQVLGKPSRQTGGGNMTPANNSWEGVLQVQNIMYVDPSAAWSAMEGFMSMTDANGYLDGEVLPVRMAQTFWMVHSISPDIARLKAIYPALARHLKNKIADPRWIYGNEKTQNEIDQEYITSWLNDVAFMKKICEELGGQYQEEIGYWEAEYQKALANYADWFFSDPTSHEAIGSYPADGSGVKSLRNGAGLEDPNQGRGLWTRIFHNNGDVNHFYDACATNNDFGKKYAHSNRGGHIIRGNGEPLAPARYPREWLQVILSGLVIKDIPTAQVKQLEQFFLDVNNPALSLSGLENLKWAPNSLFIYGLINRGFYDEAKNQLDSYLVKSIEVWEFCENYKYNATGPLGTAPTSFGASQIIEVTMLKNGVMNDGNGVIAIEGWQQGKNKAISPEVKLSYTGSLDKEQISTDLPKEVTQIYTRQNFNNEEYAVNKVTNIIWDIGTLVQKDSHYEVIGKTETHDTIVAIIEYSNQ